MILLLSFFFFSCFLDDLYRIHTYVLIKVVVSPHIFTKILWSTLHDPENLYISKVVISLTLVNLQVISDEIVF